MAMATTACKLLAVFLILFITTNAAANCGRFSISVTQGRTGEVVEGQPEWGVVVKNRCNCTQSHVKLTCTGFSSVETVNPRLFRSLADDQDHCLVNDGLPIAPTSAVRFNYAWLTPYDLPFFSAQPHCT